MKPRYTAGSPAFLFGKDCRKIAERVAHEELAAYRRALAGHYGEEAQQLASHLGEFGIVVAVIGYGRRRRTIDVCAELTA